MNRARLSLLKLWIAAAILGTICGFAVYCTQAHMSGKTAISDGGPLPLCDPKHPEGRFCHNNLTETVIAQSNLPQAPTTCHWEAHTVHGPDGGLHTVWVWVCGVSYHPKAEKPRTLTADGSDPMPLCRPTPTNNYCAGARLTQPLAADVLIADGSDPMPLCRRNCVPKQCTPGNSCALRPDTDVDKMKLTA